DRPTAGAGDARRFGGQPGCGAAAVAVAKNDVGLAAAPRHGMTVNEHRPAMMGGHSIELIGDGRMEAVMGLGNSARQLVTTHLSPPQPPMWSAARRDDAEPAPRSGARRFATGVGNDHRINFVGSAVAVDRGPRRPGDDGPD